jgi:ligand-binding sensor domain-containing protein
MTNKTIIAAGLLLVIAGLASAATWTSYTNTDGIRRIIYGNGHIWGATSGGVVSVDIASDAARRFSNTDGIGGIEYRCAEIDTSNYLWFGSGDGWLSRISPNDIIRNFAFRDSSGIIARPLVLYDLKCDGNILWVANDLGVSKFDIYSNGGEIKDTGTKLGLLPQSEDAICLDVIDDNLWVGTAQGVAFINKNNPNIQYFGNWRSYTTGSNSLGNADIRTIISYNDTVFVGTASGAYKFITSPDTVWQLAGLAGSIVYKLFQFDGDLLASAGSNLYRYNNGDWAAFSPAAPDIIKDLAVDSEGLLWAGTNTNGIAKFLNDSWTLHNIPGPAQNFIKRIALDSAGGVWMTHDNKGLSYFHGDQWQLFNNTNSDPDGSGPLMGLLDNGIMSVSVARDGNVWAGSYGGGLYKYDWTSWNHWDYTNSPMYGVLNAHAYWVAAGLSADQNGNIWVGAFASDSLLLMGVYDPDSPDSTWLTFKASDAGLFSNYVWILESTGNIVWVGRGDGFDRLDNGGTPFDKSDDIWESRINTENIADIEVDAEGYPWIAAATGLYFVPATNDTSIAIDMPPSISGAVLGLASDGVGNIWVGTVAGVGVLKPNREEPWLSTWQAVYTKTNSPLLDNNVNCLVVNKATGAVYIGTSNGLSVFESGILPPTADLTDMDAYPNPVIIEDGNEIVQFKRVPAEGTISIYTAAGELVIRFNLADRNTWDLRNSDGKRVAGGVYIFQVTAGDESGTGKFVVIK